MKIKQLQEIKSKDIKDLEKTVSKLKQDLLKNAVKSAGGKDLSTQSGKNVKKAWSIKKEISQILTIIKEKENK